ncbi:hypothetical protein BJ878DRAFT_412166 [Calycina marina]|uniref:Uncharacterized protein n=1 Tax=Calycina marina TaxID=1763456 RepID=A0A9P8CJ83_9HELO|nr:hypothetical protein BJ878DRAFT_412166 [Calycina marina]
MATIIHASTPPPPEGPIHIPGTPKHGYGDYEPYSPRRQSARVLQRGQAATTPPPRTTAKTSAIDMSSPPPTSPQTAPKKLPKRINMDGGRRVSGALDYNTTASAATALGLPVPSFEMDARNKSLRKTGMLPTPDKTPKKRPHEVAPAIKGIARTLFSSRSETLEEIMPSPRKRGKKYSGFALDSFKADDDEGGVQIYTDSHDRVPEVDASSENPFFGVPAAIHPEPMKRSSKRRKIAIPGEGELSIEEAEKRKDGMVYVFRGKKVFKKFNVEEEEDEPLSETEIYGAHLHGSNHHQPLTRSAVKPRLLFPSPEQKKARAQKSPIADEDEEAVTDIEDPELATPAEEQAKFIATPKASKFAPVSPPTTLRATRSKDVGLPSSSATDSDAGPKRRGE